MDRRKIIPDLIPVFALLAVLPLALRAQGDEIRNGMLKDLIETELHTHPKAQVVDIYKLIYQGVFGVGHMIDDSARAAAMLDAEITQLNPTQFDEAMLTACNPEGTQFRLHLRPFIGNNGDPGALFDALLLSATQHGHDTVRFIGLWKQAGETLKSIAPRLYEDYPSFTERARAAGYPPAHHSDVYRKEYAPAYRVLTRQAIERFFPSMLQSALN